MKQFMNFVRKEFIHILRDRRTMLVVIGIPIVEIILFGFALSTEINNINVAIETPRPTPTIERTARQLDANDYFTFVGYVSPDEIDRTLRLNTDAVIRFENDFERNIVNGTGGAISLVIDASNPNNAAAEAMYLQSVLGDALASGAQPKVDVRVNMLYNPQMKSSYNFVPGIMGLILILICSMMTSISIVREKQTGTMEVLLVSPVRPIFIIFAKMTPYLVISCINLITILLLSFFLLDVPLGNLGALCVVSVVYIMLSLSLGLLISNFAHTQVTAMLMSGMILMMPMMMLSGMIFPVDSMPRILQIISATVPARWFISAAKKLMIQGLGIRYVATELSVLVGMTAFLIAVSLANFKKRLE